CARHVPGPDRRSLGIALSGGAKGGAQLALLHLPHAHGNESPTPGGDGVEIERRACADATSTLVTARPNGLRSAAAWAGRPPSLVQSDDQRKRSRTGRTASTSSTWSLWS